MSDKTHYEVLDTHVLHVHDAGGEFHVWLNTEVQDFDGLIIGLGETRQGALLDAAQTLTAAVQELLGVIE